MQRSLVFGSNTIDYLAPEINQVNRFRWGFNLATCVNLLTHYTKGTLSPISVLQLRALSAYMIANSGSISPVIDLLFIFPSRYFSLSLNTHT